MAKVNLFIVTSHWPVRLWRWFAQTMLILTFFTCLIGGFWINYFYLGNGILFQIISTGIALFVIFTMVSATNGQKVIYLTEAEARAFLNKGAQ